MDIYSPPVYRVPRNPVLRWIKKWVLDGWITRGPQVSCPPNQIRAFTTCIQCRRVFPHWWASMNAAEAKERGFLGCKCGGIRLQPQIIPAWQSVWWFVVRGWLIRKVIFRKRVWDPRMPVLIYDKQ